MSMFENQVFQGEAVDVDGHTFNGCYFDDCRLVYRGGDLPTFVGCKFNAVTIQLQDSAYSTVQYLEGFYGKLTKPVEETLEVIERGKVRDVKAERQLAEATGRNYGTLSLWTLVIIALALFYFFGIIYGAVIQPNQTLNNNEPLRSEIPVELYPALPEDLGVLYDELRVSQTDRLSTYEWADEDAGIAVIPLDDALDYVLDEGLPTWGNGE